MRAAVWTLALLALTGARAERPAQESPPPLYEDYDELEQDEGKDTCDVQHPVISTPATDEYMFRNLSHVFFLTRYGEDVTIFCSADSSDNLTIRNGENEHKATQVNSTTVQLFLRQPDVGRHVYSCSGNNCEDFLIVDVEPRISVAAVGGRYANYGLIQHYFVPIGEDYEVFCSGNEVETLSLNNYTLREKNLEQLPIKIFNRTAVMHKTRVDSAAVRYYVCDDHISRRYKLFIKVIIDYFPKAEAFRCVSHETRQLECSWASLNEKNEYRLFFVHGNITMLLCNDVSGDRTTLCKWDYHYWNRAYESALTIEHTCQLPALIPLKLQTCNDVFCHNETFHLNIESILKLEPPPALKVLNTSSKNVAISWQQPRFGCFRIAQEHKVEYRLLGAPWQQADMASLRRSYDANWIFDLNLHCCDVYEVKVYVKPKAASGDFWSEPSFISFSTQRDK